MSKLSIPPELEEPVSPVEKEPISFWEQKQRELVTSVVDYNLSTLYELIHQNSINLSPGYQRRDRWSTEKQSQLIESFLMNVPVPPVFLNEDVYGQYSVIDGRQRLSAIYEFLSGALYLTGLEVFSDINGRNYRDLPSKLQSVFRTRPTLRAVIILRQSDPDIKYEVFRRLNTGGVNLNAQEIRNSVFSGSLNETLVNLSTDQTFHKLLGINNLRTSRLYQEMGDVELVLRFFTFRETWRTFSGGITRSMDTFIDENRNMPSEELRTAERDFLRALKNVEMCFDTNAFRRWLPATDKWRNKILASLYDTQMLALREYEPEQIQLHHEKIVSRFQELFEEDEFQKAIKASISNYFVFRIERFLEILNQVVGQ